MAKRRDRVRIYADILKAIWQESEGDRRVKITRVQYSVGVPFDRFKGYIAELQELGLIKAEGTLALTDRGKEFLVNWSRILETLNDNHGGNNGFKERSNRLLKDQEFGV
ncbi:hypothetical protein KEJ19_07835 [Candidatus Bathyarchaeota archaeon]|nr:hypothetical protein [Candidatus Bathyarchaeota archaeon]